MHNIGSHHKKSKYYEYSNKHDVEVKHFIGFMLHLSGLRFLFNMSTLNHATNLSCCMKKNRIHIYGVDT